MTAVVTAALRTTRYQPVLSDRALEWAKCLALICMTLDHVNTYLLHGASPVLFAIGRIAFPLFAFVFAANATRLPGSAAAAIRATRAQLLRLLGYGAAAQIPFSLMHGQVWPLNILFLFGLALVLPQLARRAERSFFVLPTFLGLFIVGGMAVEYFWCGLLLVAACMNLHRRGLGIWTGALVIAATSALALVNENQWALVALPVLAAMRLVNGKRRWANAGWVFYAYYPWHLYALWGLSAALTIGGGAA